MMLLRGGLLTLFIISVSSKSVFNKAQPVKNGPALAMVCGKATQHRDVSTGRWVSGSRDCIKDKQEMLSYCKEVYPDLTITNVLEGSETVHVSSWCHVGSNPPCRGHGHNVKPITCVEGQYEPKALDVKDGCKFEQKIDDSTCHPPQYWEKAAGKHCHAEGKTLLSPQMLKPCEAIDQWNGVQFLCCEAPNVSKPKPNKGKKVPAGAVKKPDVNSVCLQPKVIGLCRALLPAWHFNQDAGECQFFHYGGCGGNSNNFNSKDECVRTCQPSKATPEPEPDNSYCGLPSEVGMCRALFYRFYYDPAVGGCKKFVFGGCGGNKNNFYLKEDCEAKCKGYKSPKIETEPPVEIEPRILLGPGPVMLDENMQPQKTKGDEEAELTTMEATTEARIRYDDGGLMGDSLGDNFDDIDAKGVMDSEYILPMEDEFDEGAMGDDSDDIDAKGVLDSENILPMEDEFDEGAPPSTDEVSQPSFIDDEDEVEDESLLDVDVDKNFNLFGDAIFDLQRSPEALTNNKNDDVNKASMLSNWVMWVGIAAGLLIIIVVVLAIGCRKNKTRSPMRIFAEERREDSEREISPEEKQLLALQQNGYENPTYKFFEKQKA